MMLVWEKLQSVNKLYVRSKTGMVMSLEARLFKSEVSKQVRNQIPEDLPFDRNDVLKLSLHFMIKDRFFIRDTSNFVKLVEDTIFDELGINDARNIHLDCRKSYLKNSKKEYIKVTIEKSNFNYNYFNEDPKDPKDLDTNVPSFIDRIYTIQDMEDSYTNGLMDCMKWGLGAIIKSQGKD